MNLLCGNCGYDVRGLPTTICPECGLDTWAPELRLKPPLPSLQILLRLSTSTPLFLLMMEPWLLVWRRLPVSGYVLPLTLALCVLLAAIPTAIRMSRCRPRRQQLGAVFRILCWLFPISYVANAALSFGIVLLFGGLWMLL